MSHCSRKSDTTSSLNKSILLFLKLRRHVDVKMADIASYLAEADHKKTTYLLEAENELTYTRLMCYEELVKVFSEKCFKISEVFILEFLSHNLTLEIVVLLF